MTERQARRVGHPEERVAAEEIVTFEPTGRRIRRVSVEGEWRYALDDLLDAMGELSEAPQWEEIRARLRSDGFRQIDARVSLVEAAGDDGVRRPTRVVNLPTLLRILEAVPGPAAEGAKEWLSRAGAERLRESEDPALAVERARKLYARQGYARDWTQRRLHGITLRQRLTQEWASRGAREGTDYAALTDALSHGAFGMTVEEHKAAKGLKSWQSLRDSMTTMELLLTSLVEETALALSQTRDSQGVDDLLRDAQDASAVGDAARRDIETRLGRGVVSRVNFHALRLGQSQRRPRVYLGDAPAAPAQPAAPVSRPASTPSVPASGERAGEDSSASGEQAGPVEGVSSEGMRAAG